MKKFLSLFAVAAFLTLASCGASEEDKAAAEAEATEKVDAMMTELETAAEAPAAAADSMATDSTAAAPAEVSGDAHAH